MADQQVSPLAAIAGGGNQMQTQMMQQMMDTAQKKQSYLEQQQAAYNADMEKYAQMVGASQEPGAREAQMWGGMAKAAASVAPTWGNVGAMLGGVGGAYGDFRAQEMNDNLTNQAKLTKLRQDEVRALESKDQQAAMLKAMGVGKGANPTIKVVDGKMIKYDPITGTTEVLSGSQDQIKKDLFKTFYNAAVKNEHPDPETYAAAQVEKTLGQFGGTSIAGKTNNIPGTNSVIPTEGAEQPLGIGDRNIPGGVDIAGPVADKLKPEDAALAARLITRINANPSAATNDMARLEALLGKYQTAQSKAVPDTKPLTYPDKAAKEMEKETGKVSGKALGEEHQNLLQAAESSSQLSMQLDLLKKIYQTPNMPEGELANSIQSVRSGLKSIGIDVGPEVGAADMAQAISGKMALLTRTADGKNLMPGAMSDFEQKILRQLVPSLTGTAEGRAALIDIMQTMAQSRMRFAKEANEMATANRGILPPEWNNRKMRIMKEEMAKMVNINSQIAARFQGAK